MLTGTPWAIGVWFQVNTAVATTQLLVGQTSGFWIGLNSNGTLHGEYGGAPGYSAVGFNSAAAVSLGVWHFATLSLSGATATLTLDGAVIGAGSIAGTQAVYAVGAGTGYFTIRNSPNSGTTYLFSSGEIDEVSVWGVDKFPGAFTLPTSAYAGSEPGLLALWHLDENGADSVMPAAPTTYALTGPASGVVGQASGAFTVAVAGTLGAAVIITPADNGGGGFSPASVTLAAGSNPSAAFTYTPTTAGAKTISTTNDGALANPAALTYAATAASTAIAPDDAGLVYSPGAWLVGSGSAKTINAGSYFRTLFTGEQCTLNFDLSANRTPLPHLYYRVDGVVWTQATLATTIALGMPSSSAAWPHHHLEVVVKSTSEFLNFGPSQGGSRWSPQNAAIVFTGLTLAAGQSVSAPLALGQSVWFFGDSITEGYHAVSGVGSGAQDTDGSDALLGWAYRQRELLGTEVAVIGFGGAGIGTAGALGVPGLTGSYNYLWSGQARSFTPAPDLIVVAYGENDGTSVGDATFVANYKTAIGGLLAATSSATKIACLIPFSQSKAADIAAAISQIGNPRVVRIDTAGIFSTTDSVDGQHPLGAANLGAIGPAVANKLRPLLQGVRNRWVRA